MLFTPKSVLWKILFSILLIFGITSKNYSQSPCTNPPNGEGCLCSTAGILCTPDELDGFSFSMSPTTNDGDLPDGFFNADLCPGLPPGGFPNNVNFFAFVVWCEDLTFDVEISNCEDNPGDGTVTFGVQMALFASCGSQNSGWDPVNCLTNGNDYCFDTEAEVPAIQTFDMTGLEIGNTYYFMLDGCAGSICDITINVVGVCGTGMIDDWDTGLDGPLEVCVGQTYNYFTEDLNGAEEYYYYLDGVLIADGDELQDIDITWDMVGTYTLCVDVSNLPCVLESDEPMQDCITINVYELDAGDLVVDPASLCPGGTSNVSVSNYNDDPNVSQYIIVVGPDGTVTQVVEGDNTSVTYDLCGEFTVYSYNFLTIDMPIIPVVGDVWTPADCMIMCCDLEEEIISFEDNEYPIFVDPPGDETYSCINDVPPMMELDWTDNCDGTGSVMGTETGTIMLCEGGVITRFWEYLDLCGNIIEYAQDITIDPIPEAVWIDPPADMNIVCEDIASFTPQDLDYTNNGNSTCLIIGTESPTLDGTIDICGGDISYTWEFTDDCNRTISYTQIITIEPIMEAAFIDPPEDITLTCEDIATFVPVDLDYSNESSGSCLISGTESPTPDGTIDICGGEISYTWEFTDDCNRTTSYTQYITIEPITKADFIDPPADITLTCEEIATFIPVDLDYSNEAPGSCLISGTESPTLEGTIDACGGDVSYVWKFTDDCNRAITYTQIITIEPMDQAEFTNLPPASITLECSELENFDNGVVLTITNNGVGMCLIQEDVSPVQNGDVDVCGGEILIVWEYIDICNRTTTFTQTVNVNPAPEAVFINLPGDINISCNENTDPPGSLDYSNEETGDCLLVGSVDGVRTGSIDYCGGDLTDTWEFEDPCGRIIQYQRNVIVAPAPEASFINPPANTSIACEDLMNVSLVLDYSNNESGNCEISGSENAVISGSYDVCGGALLYTWTFIDLCGRPISYTQNITVDPSDEPYFINLPEDLTITCDDTYDGIEALFYTNELTGDCEFSGSVLGFSTQTGNTITNTWELTLPCSGALITHEQIVTLSIQPDISIQPSFTTICLGSSYDLGEVVVTDANNTNIVVTYHTNLPADNSNQVDPVVTPTMDEIYLIVVTNEYDCEDFELFTVYIEEPVDAGSDQMIIGCGDGVPINLFDYLGPGISQDGSWFDFDGTGINVTTPELVSFNNVSEGSYNLYYILFGNSTCPNDTMILTITVIDDVSFEILEVTCINDNNFYEVYINSNGFDVETTDGVINHIQGDEYVITNIPITTGVYISVVENISGCYAVEYIDIPDCDCPDIDPPTGDDASICIDEQPFNIEVVVPNGMTANWYDSPSSTTAFLSGSTLFTLDGATSGFLSYYVESYDPTTGCSSNTKLKIDIEIIELPAVIDTTANICDLMDDSSESILLSDYNELLNNNPANTFSYFLSQSDAENEIDALALEFTLITSQTILYVLVKNPAGCQSIGTIIINLQPLPQAAILATAPACIGDTNGIISITPIMVSGTMLTSLDGFNFSTSTVYDSLIAGTYTVYIQDENNCINTEEILIEEGLEIIFTLFTANCNDNGTNTDESDDYYTVELLIENNLSNMGSYHVIYDGATAYTFNYGENNSFQLPSDGSILTITIEDSSNSCSKDQVLGPLNPCSTNCEITIDELTLECSNNDTEMDPSDDFYTVTINASVLNGAANNTYNVLLNGIITYNFNYGENASFIVPANGQNIVITLQDNEDIQCQTATDIGPLVPCSDACILLYNDLELLCFDNDTPLDPTDDFYEITFSVQAINGSTSSTIELKWDGNIIGTYGYDETIQITIPADNLTHQVEITDVNNSDCYLSFFTEELQICSGTCEVTASYDNVVCFNNNTNNTDLDDYIYFDLLVSNPVPGTYNIPSITQTGNYNEILNIGPFTISDGNVTLVIVDDIQPFCTYSLLINMPPTCSECLQTVDAGTGGTISCTVSEVTLTGISSEAGAYSWYGPADNLISNELSVVATSIGIYIFETIFDDGCSVQDEVEVLADSEIPIALIESNGPITCVQEEVVLDGTSSGPDDTYNFYWFDEDLNLIFEGSVLIVDMPGVYYLQIENKNNQCKSAIEPMVVEEHINIPTAIIYAEPSSVIDCVIKSIVLTTPNEDNVNYVWSLDGNVVEDLIELEVDETGSYGLFALDTLSGCMNEADLIISSFIEYPIIHLSIQDSLDCVHQEVTIDASSSQTGENISSYWQNQNGEIIASDVTYLIISEQGIYYYTAIDHDNGCENTDTVEVSIFENDVNISLDPELEFLSGETTQINASVNLDPALIDSIYWDAPSELSCSNCLNPEVINAEEGLYTITVIDIYGCIGTATIRLFKIIHYDIYIPNIITMGDLTGNGKFTLSGSEEVVDILEMSVFDRWGSLVFHTEHISPNDPNVGWDAKFKGEFVQIGVYVYVFEVLIIDGTEETFVGDVTVIR